MNERIKKLAEQATLKWAEEVSGGVQEMEFFDKEKFAELIVAECIGVVQKGGGMCGAISSNNLKQHFFGVEE